MNVENDDLRLNKNCSNRDIFIFSGLLFRMKDTGSSQKTFLNS